MKFDILRRGDKFVSMSTTSIECIPVEDLDCISSAGYCFRVDGQFVSKQYVKNLVSENTIKDSKSVVSPVVSANANKLKRVRCIETGELFKNQSSAAKAYQIDPAQVSDSIKLGRPRSGYTFEYVYLSEDEVA